MGLTFYFILINGIVSLCVWQTWARCGWHFLLLLYMSDRSPFYFGNWCDFHTGKYSLYLFYYSRILLWHELFIKAMSTHTLTFPGKPVVSEILLCEPPEFCSDASG